MVFMMASRGNVLIIVENLPVPFDRRVWQEANTLADAGYRVSIICPMGKGFEKAYENIQGISIYRHPLPIEADGPLGYLIEYGVALWFQFRLSLRVIKDRGFDVIHACNPPDNIFLIGLFYKCLMGKKFVFDHHDINPELYYAKFRKKDIFYRIMLLWEKLTFRTADISIATNESYKRIAIDRGGMPPDRVFVVKSGPDLNRVKPVEMNGRWRKGRQYLVGYVGVMGKQEGLDILLKGIDYLIHTLNRHDIQFLLVGDGTEKHALQRLARRLRIEDYVTFTGRVSDPILMEILSTADVCVNPDVVNDLNDKSTMNKIMEYMALGKPIVQFDLTEGRASAQAASLYAAPNDPKSFMDHIVSLLDDDKKREKMGSIGRLRVENELKWEYEAKKLLHAYECVFCA